MSQPRTLWLIEEKIGRRPWRLHLPGWNNFRQKSEATEVAEIIAEDTGHRRKYRAVQYVPKRKTSHD